MGAEHTDFSIKVSELDPAKVYWVVINVDSPEGFGNAGTMVSALL